MPTASFTSTVWEKMLAAQMRALYFGELVSRYQVIDRVLTTLLLVLTSGSAVAILADLNGNLRWIAVSFSLAAAAVSAWRLVARYADHAAGAADLHLQWNRLASDYERLWNNIHSDDAEGALEKLIARGQELSKSSKGFPAKKRMLERWYDHVATQNLAKYGSGA